MKSFKPILALLLLCVVWSSTLLAQMNIATEILTVRDGLSNNQIRDIIQDKYGYLWFSTADGLNRYDGYEITVFKNIPGDTTTLPSNVTFRMLEDSEGTMWIGTNNGLARYNRTQNTFTTYKYSASTEEAANRVIHIIEDSHKKLWVTASFGTFEFDRKSARFKSYEIMKPDNSIVEYTTYGGTINVNSAGELYNICSGYGLLKFDYDAGLFVQLDLKESFNKKLTNDIYWALEFDQDNNIWLGITKGLFKVDLNEKKGYDITPFKKRPVENWFLDNAIRDLFIDKNQNIWIGTGRNGVYIYNSKEQVFDQVIKPSSANAYQGFYLDNSGLLWFGSSRGLSKVDFDRKPFESYTFDDDIDENNDSRVLSFAQISADKKNILLGTPAGIALFDKGRNHISQKTNAFSKLNKMRIANILEDSEGVLWIATDTNGLWSYSPGSESLKNYKSKLYDNSSLKNNQVRSLALDKNNNLWIGTASGLQILKNNANKFINVPSVLNRTYKPDLIAVLKELYQKETPIISSIGVGDFADLTKEFVVRKDVKALIYSLGEGLPSVNMIDFGWLESENGDTIWSGVQFDNSFHAGGHFKNRIQIGLLDLKAGRYKLRYKSDDSHSAQAFNRLPPPDSSLWGTQIFELSEDVFKKTAKWLKDSQDKTYLTGENINVVFRDSKGNMWVGTDDGISKIDSNFYVENYFNISTDNNSLSNNNVRAINEDRNGNIWIATLNGLNKFIPSEKTFLRIWERDGLPSANLSAIEVDKQGNLWVSGLKGISKIELNKNDENFIIVNYDVKDGLQGYEFIHRSSFIDESGKLYFGGNDGFNAFYPGSSNRTPPSLVIQDIKFSNTSINKMEEFGHPDLNQLTEMNLAHNQNDLSFEFASIHFSRPDKNRIMYKMDGVDEDWVNGERRIASYTNLSPGDYVFNLRGSNGDGVWSEKTKQIIIHIAAPWYNNWAAYVIYVFIFLGLLFGIRRFEINRQQKNTQIKESQLKIESAELKAQAAELQARAMQAENERKTKELEEARQLQLSMLPKELPQLPNLDIAVYMKTATEVGGDYYDFHVSMDGTLTVVIGDATGHGMKAGTMVTTAKTLFKSYASNPDIQFSFQEFTRCIKEMNFEKLSMCMTMIKIQGNKMLMSSAGMPPYFIYRKHTQSAEEHLLQGMPLGTMDKFPYKIEDTKLNTGDTILLLSDGLPELLNGNKELYGYKRVRNVFEESAEKKPEEIIGILKDEGSAWVGDQDPDDDVTFVVIKVK